MQGSKGPGDNAASQTLAKLSEQLFNIWSPFTKSTAKAGQDIWKTGGTSSQIPLIQQLIQSLKSGLSHTMSDTQGRLGMTRQSGTPFGQRILAETQLQGEEGIAKAGPEAGMSLLEHIMNMGAGGTSASIGGLGSAASADASVLGSQNQAYSQILSAMIPKTSFSYSGGG